MYVCMYVCRYEYAILYSVLPYHIILYDVLWYYIPLYCIVCFIPFHSILCYYILFLLYHIIFYHVSDGSKVYCSEVMLVSV